MFSCLSHILRANCFVSSSSRIELSLQKVRPSKYSHEIIYFESTNFLFFLTVNIRIHIVLFLFLTLFQLDKICFVKGRNSVIDVFFKN